MVNDPVKQVGGKRQKLCTHPPHGMCPNCMDKENFGAKFTAFDQYLKTITKNCSCDAMIGQKCPSCSINFDISYKRKTGCNRHGSNGSCIQCLPPALNCKAQEYRHLDYVMFMNTEE